MANEQSNKIGEHIYYDGLSVLFVDENGDKNKNIYYYDDQIIKVSKNKCVKQIGIFNYKTKQGDWKTVPAVIVE